MKKTMLKPEASRRNMVGKYSSFVVGCSLFLAVSSFASGGGEGEAHQSIFKAYLWPVVNFLILVFLLVFAVKKADIQVASLHFTS